MRITETAQVLATIQAYSNRQVDELVIKSWHTLLEPYQLQDCLQAVQDHYRTSRDWVMPSDVIGRVQLIQAERLARFPEGLRLSDADEAAAIQDGTYGERARELRQLAAAGALDPALYGRYQAGQLDLAALRSVQSLRQVTR